MMANAIFRQFLFDKEKVLELANAMLEAHIADPEMPAEDVEGKRDELEQAKQKAEQKLDRLIEMCADGDLPREQYQKKAGVLQKEIERLQSELDALLQTEEAEAPEPENYQEKLTVLRYALEQYTDWDDKDVPVCVIEAFVEKIVVHPDSFDWYLRFDGDPNDPLRCKIKGKRKSTTTVSVTGGDHIPSIHNAVAGCDPGLRDNVLDDTRRYVRFAVVTLTKSDAEAYFRDRDPNRRVNQWQDITVNLFI